MDGLESYLDSLESLKYPELRKLAKKYGIKGNLKAEKIIEKLRGLADKHLSLKQSSEHQQDNGNSEDFGENKNRNQTPNTGESKNTKKRNKQDSELPQKNEVNKDMVMPSSRKNTPNNNAKKNNNNSGTVTPREDQSGKDLSQNKVNCLSRQATPSNRTPSTGEQLPNSGVKSNKGMPSQGKQSVAKGTTSNKRTPSLGKQPAAKGVTPRNFTPSKGKQLRNSGVKSNNRVSSQGKQSVVKGVTSNKRPPSLGKHLVARGVTPSNFLPSTKKQLLSSRTTPREREFSQGTNLVVGEVESSKRSPSLGKDPLLSATTPSETSSAEIKSSGQRQKKRKLAVSDDQSPKSASEQSEDGDNITDNSFTGTDLTSVDMHSLSQRSRRDTYTKTEASPGVSKLLSVMKDDMTNEEQKNVLLHKLNERVQQSSSTKKTLLSSEPRSVCTVTTEKKKTPAKDWNKIHQLHWSKMDSIDEYLAKKRKRTETMTQSVKKLRMLTEQIRSNIQHVKKSNTPSAMTKERLPSKSKIPQMVKSKPVVPPSPHPPVFKPSVTSVSKASFDFGKDRTRNVPAKTPVRPVRRSPRFNSTTKQKMGDSKNGTSVETKVMSSASKENFTLSNKKHSAIKKPITTGTPLKQSLNNSLPINSTKTFNIAESLAKPITWKPHKGKLKPFEISSLYVHQTDVKEVKVKSREDRRREQNKLRAEKRHDALSKRRAINI